MKENAMHPLKASELIKILEKCIEENGDLEISINTLDGALYSLFSADDVHVLECNTDDGGKDKTIVIG